MKKYLVIVIGVLFLSSCATSSLCNRSSGWKFSAIDNNEEVEVSSQKTENYGKVL